MAEANGSVNVTLTTPDEVPLAEVVPHKDRAFEAESFVVLRGKPTKPRYWVRAKSAATADGTSYSHTRVNPTDMDIGAHTRFIASGFDSTSGIWRPYESGGIDYYFRSPPGLAPHLNDVEYKIGREMFSQNALRFNVGDYLVSEFNRGRDVASRFAIAMVFVPDVPLDYTVLSTQNANAEIEVTLRGGYQLAYGGARSLLTLDRPATSMAPTYLILSSDGHSTALYIATGNNKVYSTQVSSVMEDLATMAFTVGKTRNGKATATFNLLEFCVYDYELKTRNSDSDEMTVNDVIGKLSAVYGAQ